jgi:transposase InsO family protein
VFQCFQNFHAYVKNHFQVQVQVIRTDNGTEYVNTTFGTFLSDQGILHQTSCPDTPHQNGVAERKNRHILKVAHSLYDRYKISNSCASMHCCPYNPEDSSLRAQCRQG